MHRVLFLIAFIAAASPSIADDEPHARCDDTNAQQHINAQISPMARCALARYYVSKGRCSWAEKDECNSRK